jgi:hypothetical protein
MPPVQVVIFSLPNKVTNIIWSEILVVNATSTQVYVCTHHIVCTNCDIFTNLKAYNLENGHWGCKFNTTTIIIIIIMIIIIIITAGVFSLFRTRARLENAKLVAV